MAGVLYTEAVELPWTTYLDALQQQCRPASPCLDANTWQVASAIMGLQCIKSKTKSRSWFKWRKGIEPDAKNAAHGAVTVC